MPQSHRGFTLIEAVIVIVILGIVSAVVAVFIRAPVQGYFDLARRAELTDSVDIAARRIARDLRLALPNSVRVTGAANNAIEFLPTSDGGRYRVEAGDLGVGDPLDFGTPADNTFSILGQPINFQAGDQIVIYNTGYAGADAYAGNSLSTHNRRAYNGATGLQNTVSVASTVSFSQESPSHRFQVVNTPVTYICDSGVLWRYAGYAIQVAQPGSVVALDALVAPANAVRGRAMLAQNVTTCAFDFTQGTNARNGLVSIRLSLTQGGERVSLYHEVHVNNVP